MPARRAPLWLSQPTRLAGLSRGQARIVFALLIGLLLACLLSLGSATPATVSHDPANAARDRADVELYQSIVEAMRHGGDYYPVAATALRAGDYPMRPFFTFRLPTLAVVEATLPSFALVALLYALALGVVAAWLVRLRPAFGRGPPLVIALILLAAGMAVFVRADLVAFHEVWAGPLIALSLALRRRDRWIEAVAIALIAMLIRETALLFAIVMALFAALEGERREAIGWGGAIALFGIALALHARAVAAVVGPLDPASPGWSGLLGFGFFVKAMTLTTPLMLLPLALGALLVGLALFGWASWDNPLGLRAIAILAVYAALIGIGARADTFYWAMLVAPILLLGLAFVPDAIGDLARSALDRRRITVTRMRP
ncbi:hypothetical protein EAH79_15020 [Sphingomonas koreensis]|nr:hypothetical protein EAH79_15020 [Sphingomonas koreensis]